MAGALAGPHPFGRYLLLERLATGGMAEIFLAKLPGVAGFEKMVAIKRILPHWSQNREFITMLIDEAKIVVQLTHPNIVPVYELGREEGSYYIAMEYVDGIDLKKLLQSCLETSKTVPVSITLFIITEILKGLAYAHKKTNNRGENLGIIHRDISPQNILISFDGLVKVADFGIARAARRSHETATGTLKGKFSYMSPEQANQQPLDPRSDLFSVGILFYELLVGKKLFGQKTDIATLDEVRKSEDLIPTDLSLKPSLKPVLEKSLRKDPKERFQEAGEFVQTLERWCRNEKEECSAEQLSIFLKEIFSQEIQLHKKKQERLEGTPILKGVIHPRSFSRSLRKRQGTEVFVAKQPSILPKSPWSKRLAVGLGLLGLALLIITVGRVINPKKATPAPTKTPAVLTTPAVSMTPATSMAPAITPPLKMEGWLSIQAVPWASVSIDGQPQIETPLRKRSLSLGKHLVKAYYSDDKFLTKEIAIAEGNHIRCVVNFSNLPGTFECH
ncbi:MAG: serine/threonine protein kinase [Deltaproteobacteria bacterium]|nr:serine/threonine protein kinase [Deltaproteobacteria bacterium]